MPKLDTPADRPGCTQAPFPVQDILDTFDYNPETGDLYYKGTQDKVRMSKKYGGMFTRVGRKTVAVHRLCWCVHHKEWPTFYLRHLNGNPDDNRAANLERAKWANDPGKPGYYRQPAATTTAKPAEPGW